VVDAANEAELVQRLQVATRGLGFEHFLFGVQVTWPLMAPEQHVTSGYSLEWQRLYGERNFIMVDPTVAYCQTETTPLVWSENLYTEHSFELMEEARRHGLGYGLSVPVHQSPKVKSMISLARDQPIEEGEMWQLVDTGKVLAACAHMVAGRVIIPSLLAQRRPKLSGRELECLKWVAQGKSSWAIGEMLNLSEATVNFHITNVMKKMDVASRLQAVAKGMVLGLLD
jgi:DNA-binding CsgD family transcriptional regulator